MLGIMLTSWQTSTHLSLMTIPWVRDCYYPHRRPEAPRLSSFPQLLRESAVELGFQPRHWGSAACDVSQPPQCASGETEIETCVCHPVHSEVFQITEKVPGSKPSLRFGLYSQDFLCMCYFTNF